MNSDNIMNYCKNITFILTKFIKKTCLPLLKNYLGSCAYVKETLYQKI